MEFVPIPNSSNTCSIALLFFWPTDAGSFIWKTEGNECKHLFWLLSLITESECLNGWKRTYPLTSQRYTRLLEVREFNTSWFWSSLEGRTERLSFANLLFSTFLRWSIPWSNPLNGKFVEINDSNPQVSPPLFVSLLLQLFLCGFSFCSSRFHVCVRCSNQFLQVLCLLFPLFLSHLNFLQFTQQVLFFFDLHFGNKTIFVCNSSPACRSGRIGQSLWWSFSSVQHIELAHAMHATLREKLHSLCLAASLSKCTHIKIDTSHRFSCDAQRTKNTHLFWSSVEQFDKLFLSHSLMFCVKCFYFGVGTSRRSHLKTRTQQPCGCATT